MPTSLAACVCGHSLRTSEDISRHQQTWSDCKGHTAACPCKDPDCAHGKQCPHPECSKSFRDNGTSKIHFLTHIPEAVRPTYSCLVCQAEYKYAKDLKSHQRKKHGILMPTRDTAGATTPGTSSSFGTFSGPDEGAALARLLQGHTEGDCDPNHVVNIDPSLAEVPERSWASLQSTEPDAQLMSSLRASFVQAGLEESTMGHNSNCGPKRMAEDTIDHGRFNIPFMFDPEEPAVDFQMSWTSEEEKKYDLIIKSLDFVERDTRLATIHEPSEGTSDWIFESTAYVRHEFPEWLRSDSGVFLILGKAGSGKSTLLKHIVHHEMCETLLAQWTTVDGFKHKLITATCCFWRAGSDMQKKREGLYRSLLTQILEQCRGLVPIALPKHWARQYHRGVKAERASWDVAELKKALFRAVEHDILLRFCFFIDGLDEYCDTYALREVVQDLEKLSELTNVKICITSRPSAIRSQYFEGRPRLDVEEFTQPDIRQFITVKLEHNQRFQRLMLKDPETASGVIYQLQCRSEGVFLWISLVIERLVTELEYMSTLTELERAVRSLPPGMEKLLDDIIERVAPDDRIYTKRLLLLLSLSSGSNHPSSPPEKFEPLEVGRAYCLLEEHQSWSSVSGTSASAFAHDEDDNDVVDLSEYSIVAEARVKQWCPDLVEIHGNSIYWDLYGKNTIVESAIGATKLVEFAHRTVYDYVKKHHNAFAHREGPPFDVQRATCRMSLLWLRRCLQAERTYNRASALWTDFTSETIRTVLTQAAVFDAALAEGDQTSSVVLHSLNRMLTSRWDDGHLWPFHFLSPGWPLEVDDFPADVKPNNHWILILSPYYGLSTFLREELTLLSQQSPETCAQICPYILIMALKCRRVGFETILDIIKVLLNHFDVDMSAKIRFRRKSRHIARRHVVEDSFPDEILEMTLWDELWAALRSSILHRFSPRRFCYDQWKRDYHRWKSSWSNFLRLFVDVGAFDQQSRELPWNFVRGIARINFSHSRLRYVPREKVVQDLIGLLAEFNLDTARLQDQWEFVRTNVSSRTRRVLKPTARTESGGRRGGYDVK